MAPIHSTPAHRPTSPAQAVEALLAAIALRQPQPAETVPLHAATGRILAADVTTDRPSPPFDTSSMDGYAVCLATLRPGATTVIDEARIGRPPPPLPPHSAGAIRISTGAPVPEGCDCIIKVELLDPSPALCPPNTIYVSQQTINSLRPRQAIRARGENAAQGTRVASAGLECNAPLAALLACNGVASVPVRPAVRVAILTTGDELLDVTQACSPFTIRNSSGPALTALLARRAFIATSPYLHAPDDPQIIACHAAALLNSHDVLICTGGVSMGHQDYVPSLLTPLRASLLFHHLPQRPGKPILAAITPEYKLLFGLPGNPQSTLITARRFVIPAIAALAGTHLPALSISILNQDTHTLPLFWFRHVVTSDALTSNALTCAPPHHSAHGATLLQDRGSGDLISAATSSGFVEQPPDIACPCSLPYFPWNW